MIRLARDFTLPAAFTLLPPAMKSDKATAMLLSIALQESKFQHRRQTNYGPARGFWQFEKNGVRGVMRHPQTRGLAIVVLRELRYEALVDKPAEVHYAIHDNDVLACAFARMLLWTVPGALPARDNPDAGWQQYLEGWRPGAPRHETWADHFEHAWQLIEETI